MRGGGSKGRPIKFRLKFSVYEAINIFSIIFLSLFLVLEYSWLSQFLSFEDLIHLNVLDIDNSKKRFEWRGSRAGYLFRYMDKVYFIYRVSQKKRFDSSLYIPHPKMIRFGNFFHLITCQLSPLSDNTKIIFLRPAVCSEF